ncbi:hypothetical protein EVAR_34589_1 [Eumeta japonica]|uniref:Uncharacterized protein n=1 Tax=Eumeta variegata TaxID=151549 RepID=A0A4C1VI15_EUMVA|nr:hypothetical protein EVAR_34589_1 [Eumeta japonica]
MDLEALQIGERHGYNDNKRSSKRPQTESLPNGIHSSKSSGNGLKQTVLHLQKPQGLAYAVKEVYSGIYSKIQIQSLQLGRYNDKQIPKSLPKPPYLIHTGEKESLTVQEFRKGVESRILAIYEAHGLTSSGTIIMRTMAKQKLHDSVPHAVVAITHHTDRCVYYTDDEVRGRGNNESVLNEQRIIRMAAGLGPERIKARARAPFSQSQTTRSNSKHLMPNQCRPLSPPPV